VGGVDIRGRLVTPHKLTVGQWLAIWLQDYAKPKVRPLTFDHYEMLIRRHLTPALGHIALKDLRPDQVQHFYNKKRETDLAPGTVSAMHTVLHAALKQAVRAQLVMRNVCEATTSPRRMPREMRPLTLDEVSRLLKAIMQDRLFPAIFLELGTGIRKGELLGLQWQDLDLDAGVLRVRQALARVRTHAPTNHGRKTHLLFQEPKTEYSRRTIPIPEDIIEELKHHKARQAQEKLLFGQDYKDHGLVFCQPDGQPINPRTFTRAFERLLQRAGVPRIRFMMAGIRLPPSCSSSGSRRKRSK
jgi:integrase